MLVVLPSMPEKKRSGFARESSAATLHVLRTAGSTHARLSARTVTSSTLTLGSTSPLALPFQANCHLAGRVDHILDEIRVSHGQVAACLYVFPVAEVSAQPPDQAADSHSAACIRLQSRVEVLEEAVRNRVASDGAADVVFVVGELESGHQTMVELRLHAAAEIDLDGPLELSVAGFPMTGRVVECLRDVDAQSQWVCAEPLHAR
jgi:hypothetical protein